MPSSSRFQDEGGAPFLLILWWIFNLQRWDSSGMEHQNIALAVLKKLLNDEIKSRAKKNLVKSKSLMERLENAIKKYHNKVLTAVEVMEELIKLSQEIIDMDSEASELGLSDFEYAFYTAVANNKSANKRMYSDKIKVARACTLQQLYFAGNASNSVERLS
ncbi:MAG: DUF3387 domain-containing protein [Gallionella sp.]